MCSHGTRNIMHQFFLISVSVNYFYQCPFIYSSYYPKEENKRNYTKYLQIHCEKYKEKKIFFHIVREENIRPHVFRDRISPPFFQHYEKIIISYRILKLLHCIYSLSIGYHHKMTKKKSIIDLVLHCICMTVVVQRF